MAAIFDKAELYRHLASKYTWTFEYIATMNVFQQLEAVKLSASEKQVKFATYEEYQRWLTRTKSLSR